MTPPSYYPFAMELMAGTALFMRYFDWNRFRAGHRVLSLLAIPAIALVLGYLFSPFYAWSVTVGKACGTVGADGIISLYYAGCALAVLVMIRWCWRVSWLEALIVTVAGYAAQHSASDLAKIVFAIAGIPQNEFYRPVNASLVLAVYAVAYGLVFALVGRRFSIDHDKVRNGLVWVLASILTLAMVIAANLVLSNDWAVTPLYTAFYDLICTLLCIVVLTLVSTTDKLYGDLMLMRQVDELKDKHYELTRENIELINIKCHDIRKNIASLYEDGSARPSREAVRQIENSIKVYDSIYRTGNEAMDALLSEKSLYCSHNGIRLTAMVDGHALDFLERPDLYSLFGNMLDNAVEAVGRIDDPQRRCISLTVHVNGRILSIQEENYYTGVIRFQEGLPKTSKGDERYHGFGMRSIAWQVRKYRGEMTVDAADGVFSLDIVIPLPR